MRVVVGTKNAHKVRELQRILEPLIPGLVLEPSPEDSPLEDGDTFSANALIKARSAFHATGQPALADLDQDNTALLLHEMTGVEDRAAAFVCAAALVHDGGEVVLERRWEGVLAPGPAGSGGFGYDPIFIPKGYSVTSAELTPEEKDELSHRGQAFRAIAPAVLALG